VKKNTAQQQRRKRQVAGIAKKEIRGPGIHRGAVHVKMEITLTCIPTSRSRVLTALADTMMAESEVESREREWQLPMARQTRNGKTSPKQWQAHQRRWILAIDTNFRQGVSRSSLWLPKGIDRVGPGRGIGMTTHESRSTSTRSRLSPA